MTTKFGSGTNSNLVPALGDAWGHSCTYRVVLHWVGMVRHALLYKSPSKGELSVPYQVTVSILGRTQAEKIYCKTNSFYFCRWQG